MQHAKATLRKIFAATLHLQSEDAPLLAWPLACGARTAARTSAVEFHNGVLTVEVPDRIWQQQLQGLSAQYIAALNHLSTRPVDNISFVVADRNRH